ncbi:MAG: hypothetical protein V2A54_16780 [Bacteroidota bacterium]
MLQFLRKNKLKLGILLLIMMMLGTSCRAKKRKTTCYYLMVDNGIKIEKNVADHSQKQA